MWDFNKMHSYRADYWDASKCHIKLLKLSSDLVSLPHVIFHGRGMGCLGRLIITETLVRMIECFT